MKIAQLFILLCGLSLYACNDEEFYSCNKETDKWIKENLSEIRLMTRSNWLKLDQDMKRSVFAAFTPQQKLTFWEERFEEVLELDWNTTEREHIEKLYNKISESPEWFKNMRNKDVFNEFEKYIFEWMDYAEEELKWTQNQLWALLATGDRLIDKSGTIETEAPTFAMTNARTEPDCNCSHESDWCSGTLNTCKKGNCKEVAGCGTLWLKECDGRCDMDV